MGLLLKTAINSVSQVNLDMDVITLGRGKGVLVTTNNINSQLFGLFGMRASYFRLKDVTSNTYVTVFLMTRTLEDVGFLEIQDIALNVDQDVLGNGQFKWQISGDGGTTFTNMMESNIFNVATWFPEDSLRGGVWISQVNPGTDKLQIRMQARAVSGTFKNRLIDSSTISIRYRKKVIT